MHVKSPLFSIVIPTYTRPKQLALCLKAIDGLTYPRDRLEVIIVDDGSHTPLESFVESISDRLPVRLITQSNSGPAIARNRGAAEALGDFLAFTDDDCAPSPNWLEVLADTFRGGPDWGVGGKTMNSLTHIPFRGRASCSSITCMNIAIEAWREQFFASNNLAFPRKAFLDSGGFDSRYRRAVAEDRELCDRWISQGRSSRYTPEALVAHAHPLGFGTLCRQHFTYGRGAFSFHRMRAERGEGPVRIEPLSFYVNMFTYPFKNASVRHPMSISCLLM